MPDTKKPAPALSPDASKRASDRARLALSLDIKAGRTGSAADRTELAVVYAMACSMAEMNDAAGEKVLKYIRNPVQDYIYGADLKTIDPCMWMGGPSSIKLDPTLNFRTKHNMPLMTALGDPYNIKIPGTGREILLGVRIGNPYHGFTQPAIVLGLTDDLTNPVKGHAMNIDGTIDRILSDPIAYATKISSSAKAVLRQVNSLAKTGQYRENGPTLITNPTYFEEERARWERCGTRSRMCSKNKLDEYDCPIEDYDGNLIKILTNVPWMSKGGQATVKAALNVLKLEGNTADAATAEQLLTEACRADGVPPAIAESTPGMKRIAAHLGEKKYGKDALSWKLKLPGE